MRLIDADALKDELNDRYDCESWVGLDEAKEAIDLMPTIDAAPVVRCKDCKHNSLNRNRGNAICDLGIGLYQTFDFCSEGERRANG